jgi:hypothetical protein
MRKWLLAAALAALAPLSPLPADEGMWLFTHPPREQLRERYGFEVTQPWLNHLMQASVRFNNGGSGSFVSGNGLVVTNHHVASDVIQKLSSAENNYLRDGFHARTRAEEIRAVDLELNVLQSIEDVTSRVNAAVPAGATGDAAVTARRRIMAEIEKESLEKTGLRSDVVTLYQGGEYHLYRYKRYTDVRLVFAPEQQPAFFGGDPDNFEFPRWCLDVCFFRVYENGQPVRTPHFLKWSEKEAQDGELIFVSGHPGRTSRLLTTDELAALRDQQFPQLLSILKRREVLLTAWSSRDQENARRARDELLSIQNSRKVRDGGLAALQDPQFFRSKQAEETAFKKRLAEHPQGVEALAAFDEIARAQAQLRSINDRFRFLELAAGFNAESFRIARHLLRAPAERTKPNGERLREYTDARRESFELGLFSDQPIYEDLEILSLADSLTQFVEVFGAEDALVRQVLAGKSPRVRAAELITSTRVRDVGFRRQLYEGGEDVVRAARDPMIELARILDAPARSVREVSEAQNEAKQQAHAAIGRARFALQGAGTYPDATFTLRLSYGAVKGYQEAGETVPAHTVFGGKYARNAAQNNREPFDLPKRWLERKNAVNLSVPYNFVSTADIIGGNSGSPTVNRAGEFVGIIFDGNIHSLVSDFGYDAEMSRAISVHSAGILEALRSIYNADQLIQELLATTK